MIPAGAVLKAASAEVRHVDDAGAPPRAGAAVRADARRTQTAERLAPQPTLMSSTASEAFVHFVGEALQLLRAVARLIARPHSKKRRSPPPRRVTDSGKATIIEAGSELSHESTISDATGTAAGRIALDAKLEALEKRSGRALPDDAAEPPTRPLCA